MKEDSIYSELSSIRSLMERSSKFLSLSGLSGVMAGLYALAGAFFANRLLAQQENSALFSGEYTLHSSTVHQLTWIAIVVLLLSVSTCVVFTMRQVRKNGVAYWRPASEQLIPSIALPLITGGIFIIILLLREEYWLVVPCCLIFYGLALVSGSQHTFADVKWLGLFEVLLGLACAFLPEFGLIFWIIGFGALHILYGFIMHFKYRQ